jgi:hypothetical protein
MIRGVDTGDYVMRIQVDGLDIFDSPFLHFVQSQTVALSVGASDEETCGCGCQPNKVYNFAPGSTRYVPSSFRDRRLLQDRQ